MKIKNILLASAVILMIIPFTYSLEIKWLGDLTIQPESPKVGETVILKARFTVLDGNVQNLKFIGKVDSQVKYTNNWASITAPKSYIIQKTWTAHHSNVTPRLSGQPSLVNVEFILDPDGTTNDEDTSNNKLTKVIKVYDQPPQVQQPAYTITRKRPDLTITDPCLVNKDAPTDLVPLEFYFTRTGFDKFNYTIKYKNDGLRCLKSVKYKITYPYQGVDKVLKESVHTAGSADWAVTGNGIKTITGTFDRDDIPRAAYDIYVDNENQNLEFTVVFTFFVDPYNNHDETNENNNKLVKTHHWVED